jgi:hypothetical protein
VIYGNIAIKNGYHKWSSPKDDPVGPGDGYKYRGRGFNQITFKASYKRYAKETGVDIYINPDLLNNPETAAQFTVKFLMNRLKSKGIDANSFQTTDDAVKTFAHANTGWGRSASKVAEKQAKARKEARKFKVV